ncbi:hypothetical protein D3C85_1486500 [compost metagenome]
MGGIQYCWNVFLLPIHGIWIAANQNDNCIRISLHNSMNKLLLCRRQRNVHSVNGFFPVNERNVPCEDNSCLRCPRSLHGFGNSILHHFNGESTFANISMTIHSKFAVRANPYRCSLPVG